MDTSRRAAGSVQRMLDPIDTLAAFNPFSGTSERSSDAPRHRYVLLDVFTDTLLAGNQLAVFLDARGIPAERMQALARELNISETVFALPPRAGGDMAIRIFTPGAELPFAGHPVLGAALVVSRALARSQVTLETKAGPIQVALGPEVGPAGSGWMRQPIPSWEPYGREGDLLRALGVDRSALPVELYENGPRHVYVELASGPAVTSLAPDLGALARLDVIGVCCFAGSGAQWQTRVFAPALGVPEDPATGSAAGPLAVHLARHGRISFGQQVTIRQGEQLGRPSRLLAKVAGSSERIDRVEVGGDALIVACGEFLLD